jgi:asparagine synthase (glutamine-hydrolysing)
MAETPARWLRRLLPAGGQRAIEALLKRLPPSSRYGSVEFLLKQFVRALPYAPEVRTQLLLGGLTSLEQAQLLTSAVRRGLGSFEPGLELTATMAATTYRDPLERLIYHHCRFYLADQTLVASDRATMAASLEARAPLLDHALVELTGRIPNSLKLKGWTTKYLFKKTVADLLPPSIVGRRKQGLGVPIAAWLRGPLRGVLEERLAPARLARRGLFDPRTVQRLIAEHGAGQRNHRKVLWSLLMFDAWCDRYLPHERWT